MPRFVLLGGWECGEKFRETLFLKSAWAVDDEHVIGAVYFFKPMNYFTYFLLVRDASARYRPFFRAEPVATARGAEASIKADLEIIERGEKPAPVIEALDWGVDLFAAGITSKPNQKFLNLRDGRLSCAAKKAMTEVARWFNDLDGNFVKDFQTTGYDARLWELYLFASMVELGFSLDRQTSVPDFRLSRGDRKLFIEAVTANPSNGQQFDIRGLPPPPPEDFANYIEHVMPQKFGSPLRSKVQKEYWKLQDVRGHPFLIAIADFHAPASMTWSHTALAFYLYGVGFELRPDHANYKNTKVLEEHVVGPKVVPTNFFGQEDHRHISAILFSNAGTNAKFNRMGVLAGFGDPDVKLTREGGLYDPDPGAVDAIHFKIDVEDPAYEECWADELEIYHNPNAHVPLDPALFPTLTHFYRQEGKLVWHGPEDRVLFSFTQTQLVQGAEKPT